MSLTTNTLLGSTARAPIVDKSGMATWQFLKVLQDVDVRISNSLNPQGQLIGTAASSNSSIASTDQLIDGSGHPLAGGKSAYSALVSSSPSAGDFLEFNGTEWVPVAAVTKISAGSNVTITPASGTGAVTVSAAAGVSKILAGTNITVTPADGIGAVTVNAAGAPSGGILTATATLAVSSGGGTISEFVSIPGGVANTAAFVAQLQSPGIPFSGGGSSGYLASLTFILEFSAGGCNLTTTLTPPSGATFIAGNYLVNVKAIQ